MNWADIISLINNGNWEQARKEVNLSKNIIPYDDTAAIAEASVYLHENDEASAYRCIAAVRELLSYKEYLSVLSLL